jgi:hypothetical protein
MAFQHDEGVVRRGKHKFTMDRTDALVHVLNSRDQGASDHLFNFTAMAQALTEEMGLPGDHLERYVRPEMHKVARFLLNAEFSHGARRFPRGRFQFFALDWVLDARGRLHFLESNGYPALFEYKKIGLQQDMWPAAVELVSLVQLHPKQAPKNMTRQHNFVYKGWRLVYQYMEEKWERDHGRGFNSCDVFHL